LFHITNMLDNLLSVFGELLLLKEIGKTKQEILELATIFSEMVQGQKDERQDQLGDASFLSGVAKFPQRIKCATLAWNALKKTIKNQENK